MKVALVHDYLTHPGGAERVLWALHELWPDAPIYTLLYDQSRMRGMFDSCDVRTSFLQRIPYARRMHRLFPLLMPMAIENFDLRPYDLVISSSTSFAKGALTHPHTFHCCYCHTPMRYAWDDSHRVVGQFRSFRPVRALLPFALGAVRLWDGVSSSRPDMYVANSENVARRIRKYYGKTAQVVYPPVDVQRFTPFRDASAAGCRVNGERGGALLMVGRLLPYKGFEIGIRAAHFARAPLRIVGDGPEWRRLRRLARSLGANVTFVIDAHDDDVVEEMRRARALLFPGEEDFGIVPLEAAAAGLPVVAYASGGALETVLSGVTGVLVPSQDPRAFAEALERCQTMSFDAVRMRAHAERFSNERFAREFRRVLETALDQK